MVQKKQTSLVTTEKQGDAPSTEMPVVQITIEDLMTVPKFGNTSARNQEFMEKIINAYTFDDPASAKNFGLEAIAMYSDFVDKTHQALIDGNFAFMNAPLSKIAEAVNSENMKQLARRTERMLEKTSAAVVFNKLTIGLLEKTGIVSEQKAAEMRNSETRDLANQLRDAYTDYEPLVKDVKDAYDKVPQIVEMIDALGPMNMEKLAVISLFIGTGNEIMRRYKEEVFLEIDKTDLAKFDRTKSAMEDFSRQMAILRSSQTTAAELIHTYNSQRSTLKDVASTLQSIASCEIYNYKQRLVALNLGVQTLGITNVATAFRVADATAAKATISATHLAAEKAQQARIDSPENLQLALDNLREVNRLVQKAEKALPGIQNKQQQLVRQLTDERNKILETQVIPSMDPLKQETELARISSTPSKKWTGMKL